MTSASSVHEIGHSEPMHWDHPEGCDGEGGERGCLGWGDTGTPMTDLWRCLSKTTTIL